MKKYIITLILMSSFAAAQVKPTQKSPQANRQDLSVAMQILGHAGFFHNKNGNNFGYGSAMKQPISRRHLIRMKLMSIKVRDTGSFKGYTLAEAVETLDNMFGKSNGINFIFDTKYDPEKIEANINQSNATNNVSQVDPTTGLPLGVSASGPSDQQIDPTTGLPLLNSAGGTPLPNNIGLPPLPPNFANPIAASPSNFQAPEAMTYNPDSVKMSGPHNVRGLTALELIELFVSLTDTHIDYFISDAGVVFVKGHPKYRGYTTRVFSVNLNSRTLKVLGVQLPKLGNGNANAAQPNRQNPMQASSNYAANPAGSRFNGAFNPRPNNMGGYGGNMGGYGGNMGGYGGNMGGYGGNMGGYGGNMGGYGGNGSNNPFNRRRSR